MNTISWWLAASLLFMAALNMIMTVILWMCQSYNLKPHIRYQVEQCYELYRRDFMTDVFVMGVSIAGLRMFS